MPADLPLYKSEPATKRLRLNKRFIIALFLAGACLLYFLDLGSKRSSDEHSLETGKDLEEPKKSSWEPSDIFEEDNDADDGDEMPEHSSFENESIPLAESSALPQPEDETTTPAEPTTPNEPSPNESKHYRHVVVIASEAMFFARRATLRQQYFGLRNNLRPCMHFNSDTYYVFWIHGELPKSNTPERRAYEAEKMEWNDLVELSAGTTFEQSSVLEWVNTELMNKQEVSYDYLIVQDIHTYLQLSTILHELDSKLIAPNTDSPFIIDDDEPTNVVWGSFGDHLTDKQAFVIGSSAVRIALQMQHLILEGETLAQSPNLLTNLYNYYSELDASESLLKREGEEMKPIFIREDSVEGVRRFVRWANNVEAVSSKDHVVITHVYQDTEFMELASWTQLKPVTVCRLPTREEQQADSRVSFAVVTSSFIYDYCMEPSGTRAAMNKRDYALRHGYSFVARSSEFAQQATRNDRKVVWGKIDVIEKVLPKYDWIFWLDMDAVIMNQNRSLESLFEDLRNRFPDGPTAFDQDIDLVIARPVKDPMINAGVFLMRNSPWSAQFLRDLQGISQWYKKGPSYEQGAMWDLIRTPENSAKTFLLDRDDHTFNTFPRLYRPNDFIAHFAPDKCPNAATLKGLAAADRIKAGHTVTALDNE